ncbi:MAG TPA: hypothetical protein VD791_10450 [Burkholderiales bacterium]|nr:hypothetical protein [Burkholderiales bacterium]
MSRFVELALALLVLGLSTSITPAHAAVCPTPGGDDGLALLAQQPAHAAQLLADCSEKCASGGQRELMLLVDDIPSPRHLPLVSGADEVASWHAEIFEVLSVRREDAEALEYCQLML